MRNLVLKEQIEKDVYGTIYKYPKGTIVVKDLDNNMSFLDSPLIIEIHGHGDYVYARLDQCEIISDN